MVAKRAADFEISAKNNEKMRRRRQPQERTVAEIPRSDLNRHPINFPTTQSRCAMMTTGQIASIGLFTLPAILLLAQTSAAQRPTGQSSPSLIVTPSASIAFFGPQGGPFSPSLSEYRVSASTGTVSYSIRTPSWLTASSTSGMTDTGGVTITVTVNASASTLAPGTYGPGTVFKNMSSGRGSTIRFARLIVRRPSPTRPADQIVRGRGGSIAPVPNLALPDPAPAPAPAPAQTGNSIPL